MGSRSLTGGGRSSEADEALAGEGRPRSISTARRSCDGPAAVAGGAAGPIKAASNASATANASEDTSVAKPGSLVCAHRATLRVVKGSMSTSPPAGRIASLDLEPTQDRVRAVEGTQRQGRRRSVVDAGGVLHNHPLQTASRRP